jgi:SAM-dependent methyltransferase
VADIYDATRSLPREEMDALMAEMARHIPRRGRVLDVGVGTGRFALPLQEMGFEVSGMDVSRGMMAKARAKGVRRLLFADVQRMPFRDDSFDAALLVHVLHLVGDWRAVVRESARVSGGTVVSVLEDATGPDLRSEYRELRGRMGHPLIRLEEGERALEELATPTATVLVARSDRTVVADDEIAHLRERGQSLTWEVPEDVHARIIADLRERYAGRTYHRHTTVELVVWSAADLRRADPGR